MADADRISKNHGVPKRSISPDSFDAILSELGDDPAIGNPALRNNAPLPESQTMNRHSYESDTNRLSEPFSRLENHKDNPTQGVSSPLIQKLQHSALSHERPLWLATAMGILAATLLNSYWLFELRSSRGTQPAMADETGQIVHEVKTLVLNLKGELEENHDALLSVLESVESMALQNANAMRARNTPNTQTPKVNPAEQSLKRWRYLGMSESTSGLSGLFNTGEGIRHIAINSPALEDWRLFAVTRERATFTSSGSKTIVLSISKE